MTLDRFLLAWRTTPVHDREVIDALVHPAHAAPSLELTRALAAWPGTWYWSDENGARHLVLTRPRAGRRREKWLLHVGLFLATLFTTTWAGATMAGVLTGSGSAGIAGFARGWATGLPFSLPLVAFLLTHEMGHYLTARAYQVDASPPFFLPVPPMPLLPIGTIGAFIRLRTILSDRRQLLDVGIAGPIAGFLVALPTYWLGLTLSHQTPSAEGVAVWLGTQEVLLGDSPITWLLRRAVIGADAGVVLHPVAFAGWFGIFVTMLNLLPIAQLDGGHVLYAALPSWHRRVALAIWVGLLALSPLWPGWLLWGGLVFLLSRGQFLHPPVLDAYRPLPRSRAWLGWAALVLFALTFSPVPFRI
jgi:membrane-associated protease RseP (regulator of RpoE activity)